VKHLTLLYSKKQILSPGDETTAAAGISICQMACLFAF